MKKFFLGTLIFFDLGLMGASAFVLYQYVNHNLSRGPKAAAATPVMANPRAALMTTSSSTAKFQNNPPPAAPAGTGSRRILFSYRNPRARVVAIRADFTGWKAEPMQKSANGTWTYMVTLTPGEYAYCYTADDKTFKDPANKRTKQIGRTLVSAILVAPPPPSKPPK
jgi:hypothetical protein